MVREVADELYMKRVSMVLEDFLFFSLYSFSCITSNSTTLERYSDSCSSIRTSSSVLQTSISPAPDPARYSDPRWHSIGWSPIESMTQAK